MIVISTELILLSDEAHIVLARQRAAQIVKGLGMGVLDQTKVATATSELARNIVRYAGRGQVRIETLERDDGRTGVRLAFRDEGPGIANVAAAMQDGYTTGRGMGLGLSGSKRLVNEFEISSRPGAGTTVVITKWKNG